MLFQIWSELLWVADECQGFDSYREFLTEELACRARKVPFRIRSRSNYVYLYLFKTNCRALVSLRHGRNYTWLSPSAKQRRNPPPLYQDLRMHHFGPLCHCRLANQDERKFETHFPLLVRWGPERGFRRCFTDVTSGGSRGGARSPVIFRPNWGPKGRKNFFKGDRLGLDDRPPYRS